MNKKVIAFTGKATGLPEYRRGAALAVDTLDAIRHQVRAGQLVHNYLVERLDGLSPDARRGFLVVVSVYVAAASVTAPDLAMRRKIFELMTELDTPGGAA